MLVLLLLILVLTLAYGAALEYLRRQWRAILPVRTTDVQPTADRASSSEETGTGAKGCSISVLVVMRNEAQNLPQLFRALEQQSLAHQAFELHLIDDASTDNSCQLAEGWKSRLSFSMFLHRLDSAQKGGSPKKAAIAQVLPLAAGEIIAVTDADCQPASDWLRGILAVWQQHRPVFISGPVRYVAEQTLFERMQAVEFAALIGVGAAMLEAGKPGMCNAANMAFSKQAFLAVGGYAGNAHVPSGDDEFLLQKMAARYPEGIRFLKNSNALVSTRACQSWGQFLHQRKRWAGKWRLHKGLANKVVAIGLFLYYLLLLVTTTAAFAEPMLFFYVLLALLLKGLAEYRFLAPVLYFLKKRLSLKVFLLLELVYPFYVLFFAVVANVGGFTWKERSYRYSTSAHERAGISGIR